MKFLRSVVWSTFVAGATSGLVLMANPAWAGSNGRSNMSASSRHADPGAYGPYISASREEWRSDNYGALTQRWWRWLYSIPASVNPGLTPSTESSAANCAINQEGPAWFLSGPGGTTFSSTCTIPAGKSIVAGVLAFNNSYPCPDPTFKPAAGQSLEDFLRTGVAPYVDGISLAWASLDDKPLKVRRVTTGVFGFTGAADLSAAFDGCVTGSPQVGLPDGYFTFIDPPAPGRHTLRVRSTSGAYGASEGTFTLIIK